MQKYKIGDRVRFQSDSQVLYGEVLGMYSGVEATGHRSTAHIGTSIGVYVVLTDTIIGKDRLWWVREFLKDPRWLTVVGAALLGLAVVEVISLVF